MIERVALPLSHLSLNEISKGLPEGAYTTFRTFSGSKTLPLEPQISRLEESANLMSTPVAIDRKMIRAGLKKAVESCQVEDLRIRITLDLTDQIGSLYIALNPLVMPKLEAYREGVLTITTRSERVLPKAKQSSFLVNAEKYRIVKPDDVEEVLLVNHDGLILEGLSSNFFSVKDGFLHTDDEFVLSGITRALVIEEAISAGIDLQFQAIHVSHLAIIEEAFITSASRLVLPIRQVDQHIIGSGKPGEVTKKMMGLLKRRIENELEEI